MDRKDLCGGMQERVHRRELINYAKKLKERNKKVMITNKGKEQSGMNFGISSRKFEEEFEEPKLRRIRSKRGFFYE